MAKNGFVLRISPGEVDRVPEALEKDHLIIGWAEAKGLLDPNLNWVRFREIIRRVYHANDENLRKAGMSSGHVWRFVHDMDIGDLVVVPYGSKFYVGEVLGPAFYDESKVDDDSAYRRPVKWLNNKLGIPRTTAKSALVSRMKTRGTCANAGDLVDQIAECVTLAARGEKPTFEQDLQVRLVKGTLDELRSGRIDSYGFERLIETVLSGLGAVDTKIVPRSDDKGIDILATFRVASTFRLVVGIQAKHFHAEPPVGVDVVEQLITGIQEGGEDVTHGVVVTSGTFSPEATARAEDYGAKGIPIELIDGDQLAALIVQHGLEVML